MGDGADILLGGGEGGAGGAWVGTAAGGSDSAVGARAAGDAVIEPGGGVFSDSML